MRALWVSGRTMSAWPGVQVWQEGDDGFHDITADWNWSQQVHPHYEVYQILDGPQKGAYWVPASTNPPSNWGNRLIVGTQPPGNNPVNPRGTEYRPARTYIWIPQNCINFQCMTNLVECEFPTAYPPNARPALPSNRPAHPALAKLLRKAPAPAGTPPQSDPSPQPGTFQDGDGLISFVNLTSDIVDKSKEFETGQDVCDKISNFFSTLRLNVFDDMINGITPPLPGDSVPETQWDPPVTHFMQALLSDAGGMTNFVITVETYSYTQLLAEFSTEFINLLFDVAVVPEKVISDVTKFMQNVGDSLRNSWEDRQKSFQTNLLAQCHEAVPVDASNTKFRYFPKVKYLRIKIDSSQTEFTSPCASAKYITFSFQYENYVSALSAKVLDPKSSLYKDFVTDFLDYAQEVKFEDAKNKLMATLGRPRPKPSTASAESIKADALGGLSVDLDDYPLITLDDDQAATPGGAGQRIGRQRDIEARLARING